MPASSSDLEAVQHVEEEVAVVPPAALVDTASTAKRKMSVADATAANIGKMSSEKVAKKARKEEVTHTASPCTGRCGHDMRTAAGL